MFESLQALLPLLEMGTTGALLLLVWRQMIKKDKKTLEMVDAMNEERKDLYEAHSELIAEVVAALVNKNNTDDKMATAITKLADEYRNLRDTIKELKNEAS